jgi:hypothetical protein
MGRRPRFRLLTQSVPGSLGVLSLWSDVVVKRFTERFCNTSAQVWYMLSSLLRALTATDLQFVQHPQRPSAVILPRSYLNVP